MATSIINSLVEKGTFTAYLYDNTTKLGEIPNCKYLKIGSLYAIKIYVASFNYTFETMLQIRNLPCKDIFGGSMYIAQLASKGAEYTIQGSSIDSSTSYAYIRPNFTGSITSGIFSMFLMGSNL